KSEVEFFKNEIEFISIIKMSNKVIFAYRTSFGKIFYFNDSFQLDSEKYFLGGLNTIRGYKQYMLFSQDNYAAGGSSFYLHSLETRFEYNENYEIASFIDIGRINEIDNQDSKTKYSVGLSFYYLSPIGPIGITYGHKLTEEVDKFGRLYLNIGYSF
ncbi:MAG: BamA/TamA family outer membrane protein, partial [Candidatus Cloacimonadota bacterium]|nr:BamA/TamA family outer membrane protein [Candidatus Cloacimonadota bacterium]